MSVTLDPTVPADSESPRQGASRIRALTLEVLQLFTQGGGSAVTFTNAPFLAATTGELTVNGLRGVISARASTTFTSTTVGTSPLTIASQTVTFPSLGGPFRVLVTYRAYTGAASGNASVEGYIFDSVNTFAGSTAYWNINTLASLGRVALIGAEVSQATYTNGSTWTFILKAVANTSGIPVGVASNAGLASTMTVTVFSSV